MARGSFDYGSPVDTQSEYTSDDLNEVTARKDSWGQVNRSGSVVWSYGDGILTGATNPNTSGTGGYVTPSTKCFFYGRPTLKIVTGTLSSDTFTSGSNTPSFSGNNIGVMGLFVVYSMYGIIELTFQVAKTTYGAASGMRFNLNTGVVSYYNNAAGWTSIGSYPIENGTWSPTILKYSFDALNHKYGKLWYGSELVADLSAYSCYDTGVSSMDTNLLFCNYYNATFGSLTIYLGDVIITTNELI